MMDLVELMGIAERGEIWELFQDNWVIILLVLGFMTYRLFFGNRCPECKKAHAMKRTGEKMASRQYIFGGTRYKTKCKYCGHHFWVDVANVRGHGGGGP